MKNHQKAGYPFLWCQTTEEDRIIRENRNEIDPKIQFFKWDIVSGFQSFVNPVNPNGDPTMWTWQPIEPDIQDPQEALVFIENLPEDSIIFMLDYHKYFEASIAVIRQAINIKDHLKATGKMVVFLSATMSIPPELQNDVTVLDFKLPTSATHRHTLDVLCQDIGVDMPGDADIIVEACAGLTQEEAENALAKALVDKGQFDYKTVLSHKAAKLKASGYLTYGNFEETFDDLYGLEYMKEWAKTTIHSKEAKGILIYGVPGTGKSHFAKALANETKRPCLIADFGALRGGIVGETEHNTRMMLKTVEAFSNPIVFADEFEKAIEGIGSSMTDGGTGARIMQSWMTYMEDKPPGSYWVCTCNSLDTILSWSGGALAARFDCIFFVDMPTQEECKGIARIWSEKKGVKIPEDYDFDGFVGRDIKKLATNMAMLQCDVDKARQYMIPIKESAGDRIAEIRKKARSVCIWASKEQETVSVKRRVKIE